MWYTAIGLVELGSKEFVDRELKIIFDTPCDGRDLTREQARLAFGLIMTGEVSETDLAAFLKALAAKGESVDEIVGAAEAMRSSSLPVRAEADCVDTCGTGGDGISTFNVSTTAAIIAAAAGATVAKHGNRSTSRASGSTEVLAELGIDVDANVATVERCIQEVGIGYLNARMLHPAMRFAAPVRQALRIRTIFNLLGPLTNPANARRQVLGVPKPELLEKMAGALLALKTKHAWVVHGTDGLCDLTITAPSKVIEVRDGKLRQFEITPEQVGLSRAPLSELLVDSPQQSAEAVRAVLRGEHGARRDHALLTAGAALVVAERATDLVSGVKQASQAVDDGTALQTLERWRAICPAPKDADSDEQPGGG